MINRYRVACDEKDYTFEVKGVDDFEADYYPGYGYLIRFEMPDHQVTINYSEKDTNTLSDPVSNINIVLDENPSTGFQVEANITPDGIIEADGDWYTKEWLSFLKRINNRFMTKGEDYGKER